MPVNLYATLDEQLWNKILQVLYKNKDLSQPVQLHCLETVLCNSGARLPTVLSYRFNWGVRKTTSVTTQNWQSFQIV